MARKKTKKIKYVEPKTEEIVKIFIKRKLMELAVVLFIGFYIFGGMYWLGLFVGHYVFGDTKDCSLYDDLGGDTQANIDVSPQDAHPELTDKWNVYCNKDDAYLEGMAGTIALIIILMLLWTIIQSNWEVSKEIAWARANPKGDYLEYKYG